LQPYMGRLESQKVETPLQHRARGLSAAVSPPDPLGTSPLAGRQRTPGIPGSALPASAVTPSRFGGDTAAKLQLPTAALAVAAGEVITKGVPTVVGVGRDGAAHTYGDDRRPNLASDGPSRAGHPPHRGTAAPLSAFRSPDVMMSERAYRPSRAHRGSLQDMRRSGAPARAAWSGVETSV